MMAWMHKQLRSIYKVLCVIPYRVMTVEVRVLSKEHFVLVRSSATALAIASTSHWLRSAIARGTPCSDFRVRVAVIAHKVPH